jgi:ketosteroid isomerase-like protein
MRLALAVGLCLISLACSSPAKAPEPNALATLSAEDIAAVEAVDAAFAAGMNAKDTSAVAALYTDDAKLMPPDAPILDGPAIRSVIASLIAGGASDFVLSPALTEGAGTIAYTVGTATFAMGGKTESIKYAEVLRKGPDGKWRYAVDIFNSMAPAVPAAK